MFERKVFKPSDEQSLNDWLEDQERCKSSKSTLHEPKADHDFTDSQQQCLTDVKLEFRETRRQSERNTEAEKRRVLKRKAGGKNV